MVVFDNLIKLIDAEIKWHAENKIDPLIGYQSGFIDGLKHSIFLINKYKESKQ